MPIQKSILNWIALSDSLFKHGSNPASFCLFSLFPKQFNQKIVDLIGIQTCIVGFEGEQTNNFKPPAVSYSLH